MEKTEKIYKLIAMKVKYLRKLKGWTQEDFAYKLGLTRTSIANIESCRQRMLVNTLIDMAKILEVDPAFFLTELDEKDNHCSICNNDMIMSTIPMLFDKNLEKNVLLKNAPAILCENSGNYKTVIEEGSLFNKVHSYLNIILKETPDVIKKSIKTIELDYEELADTLGGLG